MNSWLAHSPEYPPLRPLPPLGSELSRVPLHTLTTTRRLRDIKVPGWVKLTFPSNFDDAGPSAATG